MSREEQTRLLLAELGKQEMSECEMTECLGNLSELSYTAYNNGIIPFKLYHPDDRVLVQLVLLAIRYGGNGVPDELRM